MAAREWGYGFGSAKGIRSVKTKTLRNGVFGRIAGFLSFFSFIPGIYIGQKCLKVEGGERATPAGM